MAADQVDAESLEALATEFAGALSALVSQFAGRELGFDIVAHEDKIVIASDPVVPVLVGGDHLLSVYAKYYCTYDHRGQYLRVRESTIKVFAGVRIKGDPLFRYEYVQNQREQLPCAHLHVHAHRDQFAAAMAMAVKAGGVRDDKNFTEIGRMRRLHFPLGGHRFRPGLEDVLQMLHVEFGAEVGPGWTAALEEARAEYRKKQTAAAVRDCPSEALRVLQELGYRVEPPESGPCADRLDRLVVY